MYLRDLLFMGLLACCAGAQAADKNGQFAIKGVGLQTCQEFVSARETQSPQYFKFGGWMNGYLSATEQAFRRFQKEAALQASGLPDQATLARLFQ